MNRREQLIWSAGYLSARGAFSLRHGRVARLEVRVYDDEGAVALFMRPFVDLRHSYSVRQEGDRTFSRASLSGEALRVAMQRMRPFLSQGRIEEYRALLVQQRAGSVYGGQAGL